MTAGDLSLGEYRSAKLNLLAGIEKQLTLIAQNTAHADVHLSEEQVANAWEARGLRMYGDEVVETIRDLGITVD
ncbi:hypothetical protein EDF42_2147 [Curtobacterium sp. PhB172]|uniref:hypothetical protein n=1 Tax=unclassified Curtobacterium TaxID=257496 RepID=UPI000DA73162|nr:MULTISPECIES: hypothetical protein [unclassified Curtobacterium]PZE34000.1 hypothetical protein DEJ21_14215 [Curtobacterium sp. MCSS17_006]ROS63893.1 hypothetical protein EDF42_2147 [Curtobacterium sp. PhB172]